MTSMMQHLDAGTLQELKEIVGENFPSLLQTFDTDSLTRVKIMSEAISNSDFDTIRHHAHSFKGSASSLAAIKLSELCEDLEFKALACELDGADELLKRIVEEYKFVRNLLVTVMP